MFDSRGTCPANSICEITGEPYDTSLDGHQQGCHGTSPRSSTLNTASLGIIRVAVPVCVRPHTNPSHNTKPCWFYVAYSTYFYHSGSKLSCLLSFPNSLQKAIRLILFNHNYSQIWPMRQSIWNYSLPSLVHIQCTCQTATIGLNIKLSACQVLVKSATTSN